MNNLKKGVVPSIDESAPSTGKEHTKGRSTHKKGAKIKAKAEENVYRARMHAQFMAREKKNYDEWYSIYPTWESSQNYLDALREANRTWGPLK